MNETKNCPCGSGVEYADCCEPYITGAKNAPTAEALMRSRYSAYVKHAIDYIIGTCIEGDSMSREGITDWSEKSNWLGLKIISVKNGGTDDSKGIVVFEATYERKGLKNIHSEIAKFAKQEDRWFFVDGKIAPKPIVRMNEKTGRNEPCFCGSGKKYKYCCGR